MKVITLLVFACLCINVQDAYAGCKQVDRTNRGTPQSDGSMKYRDVDENVLTESNFTYLKCDYPGDKVCQFKDGTIAPIIIDGVPQNAEQIEETVQMQIASGILSGTVNGDGGVGSYTWTAVDIHEYTLTMCDGL
ncbi:MAG: hypothetical protein R2800_08440 [Flavipsychrobacter sp.]